MILQPAVTLFLNFFKKDDQKVSHLNIGIQKLQYFCGTIFKAKVL